MRRSLRVLFSALTIVFFLWVTNCSAQDKNKTNALRIPSLEASAKQAYIYFEQPLSEADKSFIVKTFSDLPGKIISCISYPLTQFINIRYTMNIKERDILEVMKMNGYNAYLMKEDHLKVILTVNGEAMEELAK